MVLEEDIEFVANKETSSTPSSGSFCRIAPTQERILRRVPSGKVQRKCYNEGLCFAKPSTVEMGLLYVIRLAVYYNQESDMNLCESCECELVPTHCRLIYDEWRSSKFFV